ncbi:hypothetical protein [Desulfoluna sp.]|uniref:hypothetical protein n=1 Tax=Desulfoluna sp. TaxID=2045199 RepID=UPI0026159BD5|nr:hypothetical protein [Desulfoluna sp.]
MDLIIAILDKFPAVSSVFVITPDEAVAHACSNRTDAPPCPAHHLNQFYHNATRLIPESHEVCLSFGPTCVTLRPLPLNWVLAVQHQPDCSVSALDALHKAAQTLPKTDAQRADEAFSILTPDAVMAGALGAWLVPMMKLLEEVIEAPPQTLFQKALNEWIDREDPSFKGLHHFSDLIAAAITDTNKRSHYAEKAKGIFTSGEKTNKGKTTP